MPAGYQKGADVLVKIGDGGTPTELFTVVGACRSNGLTVNRENIDVTNKSSGHWQELIAGGVRSIEVTGAYVYKSDSAEQNKILDLLIADDNSNNFQIVIPGSAGEGITFEGNFFVTGAPVESAEHNGEVSGSFTLASNGAVTLTRA